MGNLAPPGDREESASHHSTLTKSPGPNELMHPEISMKNHQIFTYCFRGSGPAIFPASVIYSHACIVLGALPLGEGGGAKHSPPGQDT